MNLALFDFDGTITQREMFAAFMQFAAPRRRLMLGMPLFAPLVAGYKLGMVSGSTIRAQSIRFGFRGVPATHVRMMGQRFAEEMLPAALRPQALKRIQWHRDQGDKIVVVSGALDVYLEHWCSQHGLDVICSRLEIVDGRLTGRYRGLQCVGTEKSRRVRETCELERFPLVYAYGDTPEDLDMLSMAHHKYYRWQALA
ncbi:HAD family hydrolase [Dyella monticola]|uniref:HAD family hydrolase n=1 Tax=Dyella monticola TaxID=1927958 RepID=A0A370X1A0_9GAMM|nr:HAD family hydrolase [Dyella monticola]RDS82179.1 HAD family hydrolase [Dyella monticola]